MPRRRNRGGSKPQPTVATVTTNVKQKVLDELTAAGEFMLAHEGGASLSDEDLRIAIKGTEISLAYLEGRGRSFDLAANVLRRDLLILEQYRDMRKHIAKRS